MSQPIGIAAKSQSYFENTNTIFDQTINNWQPMEFDANHEQKKNYTFNDKLKQDDTKDFVLALKKEIKEHTERGHWTIVLRNDVGPEFCDDN